MWSLSFPWFALIRMDQACTKASPRLLGRLVTTHACVAGQVQRDVTYFGLFWAKSAM